MEDQSLQRTYPEQWRDYRVRFWMLWGSWLGVIPAAVVIGVPLSKLFHSEIPFASVGIAGMATFAIGGARLVNFECPRCGNFFHRRGGYSNIFSRRCLTCRLPRRG